MADVDVDIEVDAGDSVSTLRDLNRDLGSLEDSTGKAATGLDALGGAAESLSGLMHAGDQRANQLARAHIAVERAADDLQTANNDLKRSQLDVNRADIDGAQAANDLKRARLEQSQAQQNYNDAVKEFGPNSTEAKTAALDLEDANIAVKDSGLAVQEAEQDKREALQDGKTALVDAKESSQDLKEAQQELAKTEGPEGSFMWIAQIGTDILGLVALFVLLGGTALASAASVALSWIIAFWPLILIGLLIAAFVVLVILYWDEIKAGLAAAWAWLKKNVFEPIGRFFTETIPRWAGIVRDKIVAAWNWVRDQVLSAWNRLKSGLSAVGRFFTQTIPGWVATGVNWVRDKWNGLVSFFSSIPSRIAAGAKGMWSFVTDGLKNALNGAIGLINDAIFFINDKLIGNANRIPGVNIPWIPYVPFLAEGGVTTGPTLAMIGEGREQEAVLPLSRLESMINTAPGAGRSVGQVQSITVRTELDVQGGANAFTDFFREVVRTKAGGDVVKYAEG